MSDRQRESLGSTPTDDDAGDIRKDEEDAASRETMGDAASAQGGGGKILQGSIDQLADGMVAGWAIYSEDPTRIPQVYFYLDDELAGNCPANIERADVQEAGHPTAICGFLHDIGEALASRPSARILSARATIDFDTPPVEIAQIEVLDRGRAASFPESESEASDEDGKTVRRAYGQPLSDDEQEVDGARDLNKGATNIDRDASDTASGARRVVKEILTKPSMRKKVVLKASKPSNIEEYDQSKNEFATGFIDSFDNDMLRGCATVFETSDVPAVVEVKHDGVVIAADSAFRERQDVHDQARAGLYCGFEIDLGVFMRLRPRGATTTIKVSVAAGIPQVIGVVRIGKYDGLLPQGQSAPRQRHAFMAIATRIAGDGRAAPPHRTAHSAIIRTSCRS